MNNTTLDTKYSPNNDNKKFSLFKLLHDYPIEIYLMYFVTITTVFLLLLVITNYLICRSENRTYNYIKNL